MHLSTLARRAIIRLLPAATILIVFGGCMGSCQDNDNRSGDPSPWRPSTPEPLCDRWQTACDGACVSTTTDPQHCGECGRSCETGQYCAGGNCVDECEDPFVLCGDECVSLSNTGTHCGECGNECRSDGASAYCSRSECRGWECDGDHLDSDGDPSNGCERECRPLELRDGERVDIELPVIHVKGTVSVDGDSTAAAPPAFLLFQSLDTESEVYVPVDTDGAYEAVLYAGHYRIHRVEEDCPTGGRCPGGILREAVHLQEDSTLRFDDLAANSAPDVRVSGKIRVNGRELPPHPDGEDRGFIRFLSSEQRVRVSIGPDGDADFSGAVPPGRYDIFVSGDGCDAHALPCQSKRLEEDRLIDEDTVFNWDVDSIELSGQLTVNGEQLSGPGYQGDYADIRLRPTDPDEGLGNGWFSASEGDSGRFSGWVYPSRYQVSVNNGEACGSDRLDSADRSVPCSEKIVRESEYIGRGHVMDIDLEVARLTGEVTVNGETMPDSSTDRYRGFLQLREGNRRSTNFVPLGKTGAARFDIPVYPGEYDIELIREFSFRPEDEWRSHVLPAERLELDTVTVDRSQSVSFDVEVYELTGRITVDGKPVVLGERIGYIDVRPMQGGRAYDRLLEAGEPAEFAAKVYGQREYTMWLRLDCQAGLRPPEALPCGNRRLKAAFTPTADEDRTYDLSPVEASGTLLVDGSTPASGGTITNLNFRADHAWLRPSVRVDDDGQFEFLAYPGTYEVDYFHNPDACRGSIPCGSLRLGTPAEIEEGQRLTIDVPATEIWGDVTFEGSENAYPAANGIVGLTRGRSRYRTPVVDGAFGPVSMVEGDYYGVYQQRPESSNFLEHFCTLSGNVPCHQYRIDVCQ